MTKPLYEAAEGNPLVAVFTEVENGAPVGRGLWIWCPGCEEMHRPRARLEDGTGTGTLWDWNGRTDEGFTISPSLLTWGARPSRGDWRCHSFIRDGHWQYLGDSTHPLASQTVPMVPVPDWVVGRVADR